MTNDELIKKSQEGNKKAFEELVNNNYDLIYKFAYKWCGNKENAEDITQQACIKLVRSIDQFQFKSKFTSWIYRLTINCAKDWYKSNNNYNTKLDDIENHSYLTTNNDNSEDNLFLLEVLEIMEDLPDGIKETMILVHAEGYTHSEAAIILEVKESTVSWRIHEARKQIKARLKDLE